MIRSFASHDWGKGGKNHERVRKVVAGLRERGVYVWFDEDHMKKNIVDAMCKGIQESDVILVFVTRNYIEKVASGNESDNVRREFMFAYNCAPQRLLAVRFEMDLPMRWEGPVGMALGFQLYTDVSTITERSLNALAGAITKHNGSTMWKYSLVSDQKEQMLSAKYTIKERVQRATRILGGETSTPNEHTSDVVKRMLLSVEPEAQVDHLPLIQCLEMVEHHLGLS